MNKKGEKNMKNLEDLKAELKEQADKPGIKAFRKARKIQRAINKIEEAGNGIFGLRKFGI